MKSIYVLGAGASIGHMNGEYPSIDTFFKYAKKYNIFNENVKTVKNEFYELDRYVKKILNKNIMHSNERINIEELLTFIEIENEYNPSRLTYDLKEDVINLIRKTLMNIESETQGAEYKYLLKSLEPQDTIITFNWDILLDNKLGRNKYHFGYGNSTLYKQYEKFLFNLSGARKDVMYDTELKQPYTEYHNKEGFYIKLHGSIDWFICQNENCPGHIRPFPVKEPNLQNYCAECHSHLVPLIIPPVLNKSYKNMPFINMLWNTAIKEINSADKIVIWGYSIPPTDFHSNWLLRQIKKQNIDIVLVNPECKNKYGNREDEIYTLNTEYNRRVRQIFGGIENNSFNYYDSYSDYYNRIDIIQKYSI